MQTVIRNRYCFSVACILVFFISFLCRFGVLSNSFVIDDFVLIFNNDFIHNINNLLKVLNPVNFFDVLPIRCGARPVTVAVFIIDNFLFGLKPGLLHLSNLILHALNSVLIFCFAYYFNNKRNFFYAFSASLFFSLHPLQSEVVGVISFKADLLFSFFALTALNLINVLCIKDISDNYKKYILYLLIFLASVLSFFSKENAVVLPLLLLLISSFFYYNRKLKIISLMTVVFVIILFLFFWIERFPVPLYYCIYTNIEGNLSPMLSISLYLKTILTSVYYNIMHILYPVNLSSEYMLFFSKIKIFSAFFFIILYFYILLSVKISKYLRFIMLFILISYIPVANIVPLVNTVTDRYLYFVMTGVSFVFGVFVCKIYFINKKLSYIFTAVLMVLFCILSFQRNQCYNNSYSLYKDAVLKAPCNVRAVYNMGMAYYSNGEYSDAITEFDKTFGINNLFMRARSWMFTGLAYKELGDMDKARKYCHKAFLIEPLNKDVSDAFFGLFNSYEDAKMYVLYNTAFLNNDINKALNFSE